MKPPKGANTDDEMHFDITLLGLHSKNNVRVVGAREDIYKIIKQRSELWESPREPYEVPVFCSLLLFGTTNRLGFGKHCFTSDLLGRTHDVQIGQ